MVRSISLGGLKAKGVMVGMKRRKGEDNVPDRNPILMLVLRRKI